MTLEAIRYRPGSLQILNQLLLPHQSVHEEIRSVQDAYEAIRSMKFAGQGLQRACARPTDSSRRKRLPVLLNRQTASAQLTSGGRWCAMRRCHPGQSPSIAEGRPSCCPAVHTGTVRGAPAIAIVGCLSVAVELRAGIRGDSLVPFLRKSLAILTSARPTAVNMARAAGELLEFTERESTQRTTEELTESVIGWIEAMLQRDIDDNQKMGNYGAQHILSGVPQDSVTILTHGNTGSLATAGYGTALGVVRSLHALGRLKRVYCTETRPGGEGARLTAHEAAAEGLPATLITDSAAAVAMRARAITAVVVGADRVVANGDTAHQVGTYQLAIAARHHRIPFYVVAPSTSCDLSLESGRHVVIEERPPVEMTSIGGLPFAAPGIEVWNPAFDVTPHQLITGGIITELGVFLPSELQAALTGRLTAL